MAKEQIYNTEIVETNKGVNLDVSPINQPKGSRRFTLNGIEEASDGQQGKVSNEPSNAATTSIPIGFVIVGNKYIEDDSSVVLVTDPNSDKDQIGLLGKDSIYRTIVDTQILGLDERHQCDIVYRLRRGNERVIYWVDGNKKIRTFNIDRPHNFYSQAYQSFIRLGGNPLAFVGEKWDASSFDLVKSYSQVPTFGTMTILESGNTLPGSYSFAIQLVDDDLNPTAWITTSNTINIYNDATINSYARIRGSRNVQNDAQSWPRASKSIKIEIDNLDQDFPFYRVAIIRAAGNTGIPDKVLASDLYSTSDSNFLYTGDDSNLTEVALSDILIDGEIIFAPQHIEQLENRLIVANGKGKGVNWCDFQKYASKIATDIAYRQVLLNNVASQSNVKNGNSAFISSGYMPGEVYSMGVVYLFDDMTLSPVFHIPGTNGVTGDMKKYELGVNYLDIHNCSTDNYWGLDSDEATLVGKPIRHHRFPFRHEVVKPLVASTGTTTDITKHRLKIVITLNPAWTPGPIAYPTAGAPPEPLLINYKFNYQVTGAGSTASYSGQLTDNLVENSTEIVIYDDNTDLSFISGSDYTTLDGSSELASYQGGGNDRFIITQTKEDYVLSSSFNDDIADIFGFQFSNIERPRADVIGFYIVRNERLDDDRLIVDNAIIGPNTTFQQYVSFGLINPKQYYHADNCGRPGDSGKTLLYDNKSMWFFNPEFEYFGKKLDYDRIEIEGRYTETSVNMPTISDVANSPCNSGGGKGVYINDVQAGTSYDPAVNKKKDKDDDGFDLLIGYRNINMAFTLDDGTTILPTKKRVIYLNAANYLNFDTQTFYNVSIDNKIGMYLTTDDIDIPLYDTGTTKNSLLYGAMVRENTTAYSNFMTRTYYKEHNNPVLFGDNEVIDDFEVFNGDADISAMNFVSTVFYDIVVADRPKKSGLWKIILGSVLLVAGILLAIPSVGSSLSLSVAAATALASLAISYGVSLAMSGIKFEQFKSMVDVDYELGLKDTVTDGGVYETIREAVENEDDTIRWFADRVSNIYIESSVPFGLRSGLTSGVSDFTDSPQPYDELGFRSYLTEKLTTIDRDQGSGRIYKGYASAEVYDMNLDYMRFNKQKNFIHLALEYDCCSDYKETFPLRRWWSEQSFQEEKIDNYRVFLPNNYNDMEGEHGEVTDLYRQGNNLFVHTKEALWQQPANLQERTTDEIVTFIGTGEFLAIPPRKILDDDLGSAGTKHKWATVKTPNGVVFVDEVEHKVCIHADKLEVISLYGIRNWCEENVISNIVQQLYNKFGIDFSNDNNPASARGVGYLSAYDKRFERVVITKKDYALLPDKLALLNVITTDSSIPEGTFYYDDIDGDANRGKFYTMTSGGAVEIILGDSNYFENKSFTLSFSFHTNRWASWHSYLPNYYIHTQNNLYSFILGADSKIWKHNQIGSYGIFYDRVAGFQIEMTDTSPLDERITEDITVQCEARTWDSTHKQFIDARFSFFNALIAYNSRQSSGYQQIIARDTPQNPSNWYQQQIVNTVGQVLAARRGRNWNINNLRDYVNDYSLPLFTTLWLQRQSRYYIDKVVTDGVIDQAKVWYELKSFTDKYIVIRLIFDNFSNVNLILNYTLITEQTTD